MSCPVSREKKKRECEEMHNAKWENGERKRENTINIPISQITCKQNPFILKKCQSKNNTVYNEVTYLQMYL